MYLLQQPWLHLTYVDIVLRALLTVHPCDKLMKNVLRIGLWDIYKHAKISCFPFTTACLSFNDMPINQIKIFDKFASYSCNFRTR